MQRKKNRNRHRGRPVQPPASETLKVITNPSDAVPGMAGAENSPDYNKRAARPGDVQTNAVNALYYPLANGDKVLNVKPANLWMTEQGRQPTPKKLFGEFWLEGELCLMYADTNMGKSILAVQIGDSISRGEAVAPFELETATATTLYIDFELSAKQFEIRYRLGDMVHQFSPVFFRAEYNTQIAMPGSYDNFDDYIQETLDWAIRHTSPRVLIIDNISCLSEGNHHAPVAAVNIMKHLKALQVKHRLSILVLAHTHKRQATRGLTRNDMGGSKMLMNFADSAFAIGQSSTDASLRYLKQMKQRTGTLIYGEDKVCLCKLVREGGFLKYEFTGFAHEYPHLRRNVIANKGQVVADTEELHYGGLSQREIARRLNVSASTVNRMLEKHYQEEKERADGLRAKFAVMREREGIPTELENEQNGQQLEALIDSYFENL